MVYCAGNTPRYSMDYFAYLTVKESCSILEHTTPQPRTAGRLRVVPLFLDARRKRSGEDFERMEEDGRRVERERESEEEGTGIGEEDGRGRKRKEEDGEDGHETLRRKKQ